MKQEPRWDEQEMDANKPASPHSFANKQPWENLIGMSPEGIIISYGGAQKGTQETQQLRGQEDVFSLPGGWGALPGGWVGTDHPCSFTPQRLAFKSQHVGS